MSRWIDALLLGPARRRRRIERQLRALDRQYAGTRGPSVRRRGAADGRSRFALAVAVAGVVGLVALDPALIPSDVRQLVGFGPKRLAEAPVPSGSGSFGFLAHQPGDVHEPVGYDPCHEVSLRINPKGGPRDAVAIVRSAMKEVGDLTGLVFRYDGLTTERPHWDSPFVPTFLGRIRTRPVLVSWASAAEVPELSGEVAGIGGSVPVTGGDGVSRYVTGGITLDVDSFEQLASVANGREEMRAIVLHEFGHLVGLAHVDDPAELMNADNLGLLDFGSGDRLGLARVGSGSCA